MIKYFTLSIFIFSQLVSSAQQIQVSGVIRDSKSGEIVPFATIELMKKNLGVAADFHGKFQIQFTDDCLFDTLKISSLGYETKFLQVNYFKDKFSNVLITLNPVVYILNEVEITGIPEGKYRLGNFEETKKGYGGHMGERKSQIAVFMDSKKYNHFRILSASFFIARKSGRPETPFRVRVYSVDQKTGNPGADMVHENIIVHGKRNGGWLTVDLSKYNLQAPVDGYFIAMEWINSGEEYYYQTYLNPIGKLVTCYGQVCSITRIFNISNTWLYILGNGWHKFLNGDPNALIISEIEVLK